MSKGMKILVNLMRWDAVIGSVTQKDYEVDELV